MDFIIMGVAGQGSAGYAYLRSGNSCEPDQFLSGEILLIHPYAKHYCEQKFHSQICHEVGMHEAR